MTPLQITFQSMERRTARRTRSQMLHPKSRIPSTSKATQDTKTRKTPTSWAYPITKIRPPRSKKYQSTNLSSPTNSSPAGRACLPTRFGTTQKCKSIWPTTKKYPTEKTSPPKMHQTSCHRTIRFTWSSMDTKDTKRNSLFPFARPQWKRRKTEMIQTRSRMTICNISNRILMISRA